MGAQRQVTLVPNENYSVTRHRTGRSMFKFYRSRWTPPTTTSKAGNIGRSGRHVPSSTIGPYEPRTAPSTCPYAGIADADHPQYLDHFSGEEGHRRASMAIA